MQLLLSAALITTGQFPDPWDARGTAVRIGAVERSRAAKRVRRSEVILRPLAAETFIYVRFCIKCRIAIPALRKADRHALNPANTICSD